MAHYIRSTVSIGGDLDAKVNEFAHRVNYVCSDRKGWTCITMAHILIIIIIIMGLRSVSTSKDIKGDPSHPGTNNSEILEQRREEREKASGKQASFHFNRQKRG